MIPNLSMQNYSPKIKLTTRMSQEPTALLLIDMQQDFVRRESPVRVAGAAATVPAIAELLKHCRTAGIPVYHIIRSYDPDGSNVERTRRELFLKQPFIVRGTPGAKIIPELTPAPGEHILIKPRYSAFFQTGLDRILREHGTDHLLIAGTQYPNCIRATVTDALSLDYRVTLLTDCCSAQTPEIASANIADLQNLGARCITFEEWQKTRP